MVLHIYDVNFINFPYYSLIYFFCKLSKFFAQNKIYKKGKKNMEMFKLRSPSLSP